ncbi:trans-acting enoyl reductase family protein [Roseivirga sp. BDSF3-8]|uniref:saccharopine dehydrogenase family protein n=1 Tax=Roseivirga sp. BDSF3-8 TaxID=3241598 RepID=UPI003531A48E
MNDFLIYGAYGFTGKLIARKAHEKGLAPLLAGRDEEKTKEIATELGLPWRAFSLGDSQSLDEALKGKKAVIHAAGPYSATAKPMVEACLRNGVHYLDITGELEVFEYLATLDSQAKEKGIALVPGTGFDVVPTDCLAAHLKEQLPDAHLLELAFKGGSNMSRGTALTMLENIHKGGAVRRDGAITKVPGAWRTREIPYRKDKSSLSVSIPWGDVSTAYHSTGIPNIIVYTATSPKSLKMMRLMRHIGWLLKGGPLKSVAEKQIRKKVKGPDDEARKNNRCYVWGEVKNHDGEVKQAVLETPEAYRLTAESALLAAQKIMQSKDKSGFMTPSMAFGKDYVLEIEGAERKDL